MAALVVGETREYGVQNQLSRNMEDVLACQSVPNWRIRHEGEITHFG